MLRFLRKVRIQTQRGKLRRELAEELALHAQLKLRECEAAGLGPEAAGAQARREMGNVTLAAEESAELRSFVIPEQMMKDVRYALRLFARQPAFSLVVVLSLALGIAGATAVFSAVNALLIKPLPFREPDRLLRITSVYPKALLVYFQQHCRTMEVASVSPGLELNVESDGPAYRITASAASANLFRILGAPVAMGRAFEQGDDVPGRDRIAILSHDLWVSRFHSDPNVIGQVIRVNEIGRRVVGVMPAHFAFPSARVQLWFPAAIDPRNQDDYWAGEFVPLIGRLRPGATAAQARSEVHSLAAAVWKMFPWPMPRHWNADSTVVSLQADLAGDSRSRVLILLCAVGAMLLIACANVASLLAARAITRRKEIALRAALGAGTMRIARQLLTESLVLAALAGAAGLTAAVFALQMIRTVVPPDLLGASAIQIDWNVAAFAGVISFLAGLSFGIAPALTATRIGLVESVKAGGQRGASLGLIRLRNTLVAVEIALTVVLVIGAALLFRSLNALSNQNPGFEARRVMAIRISPDASFCAQPAACIAFYGRLLDQLRGAPGVVDAAVVNTVPLDGLLPQIAMDIQDHPKTAEFPAPMFWTGAISPGYLRVMQIPLLDGRPFSASDARDSEPVVLITASTARRFWPGESAIGKHIKATLETHWRTVVGVVADVRQFDLKNSTPAGISGEMYMPYAQAVESAGADLRIPSAMDVLVRTSTRGDRVAEDLQQLASSQNPNVPVGRILELQQLAGASVSNFRVTTWLFLSFAGVAVFLAAIGIYGLVSYSVAQRTYEISIRMAIGATPASVVRMILARSLQIALIGTSAGLVGAFILTRGLAALLYDIAPSDPLTYLEVAAFLFVVTGLASIVPAWRAARTDPVRTLRAE